MDQSQIASIIPHYQQLPFPAPFFLLELLLVLGFLLHVVPMNMVLGGTPLALTFLLIGRGNQQSNIFKAGVALIKIMPLCISFAITQGIVPLLFVQLLYGPLYYTSSILEAIPWAMIIPILLVAYSLNYLILYRYLSKTNEKIIDDLSLTKSLVCLSIMLAAFIYIGLCFTSNSLLMLAPDTWQNIYNARPNGNSFYFQNTQMLPRFLHFLIGGLAIAGLGLGSLAYFYEKTDLDFGQWLRRTGAKIFLSFTAIEIFTGIWFLLSTPRDFMLSLMGKNQLASIVFIVALVFVVLSLILSSLCAFQNNRKAFGLTLLSALIVLLSMIELRQLLRVFMSQSYIHPELVPVSTQWDLLSIFIVCAVMLIAYLAFLLRLTLKAFGSGNDKSQPIPATQIK